MCACQVLIATLKHAKPYVECVQKKWMAFLGTCPPPAEVLGTCKDRSIMSTLLPDGVCAGTAICTHTDEVARFLKHFQNSTRQIQNICAHGKVWVASQPPFPPRTHPHTSRRCECGFG